MKLMERMKVCVSTKKLLLLCCCFIVSTVQERCDHSITEGSSYSLPLANGGKGFTVNHEVAWKHDEKLIVSRKRGKFSKGGPEDIDAQSGSLKWKNVQKTSSGTYKAEVWDTDGQIVESLKTTCQLTVTDKVPKPSLNVTCSTKITLSCNVPQPQGLSFKWSENGKDLANETPTLIRPVDTESTFTCTVSNPGGSETSQPLKPSCRSNQGVTDKVLKPLVSFTCNSTTKAVSLTCTVSRTQGLSFKWSENGKEVVKQNQMTLIRPVDTESTFTCTVSNPGGSETSLPLKPSCPKESIFPEQLFGFDFWLVVGIFACGIALLLTLIVITVCCCRRARRQRQRRLEEEAGFRLDPTNKQQQ